MRITEISVGRSITVFTAMFMVTLMGWTAYWGLPRESNPDVKIPFVMVFAPYYGTTPRDMENLVTRKLENELKSVSDLHEMSSTSGDGVSTVVLEFNPDVEMVDVLQRTRDAVELAKPELPQDVREDLLVFELSSDDWPIMNVIVSGDYDPVQLKKVGEDLQERIEDIKGVLEVDLSGGIEREVRIDVNPERLRFYELGLPDVQDAIVLQNIAMPGGELKIGAYDYQVRVPGEFETIQEIEEIVVNPAAPTPVYIRDVAKVSFGIKDRDTYARLNSTDAVSLAVKKRAGENILAISDGVHVAIEEMREIAPPGTRIQIVSDQSIMIRSMVSELQNNVLTGMLLVVAVLFLFLGFTNSLFVGVAIPFSMLTSFVVLRAIDYTLNMVVLFSLILALGMLVDNAIVIVENIFRHRVNGQGRVEAALNGTSQVSGAVVASTLTTISAFLPLVFWPGIMGEFMSLLPVTVIITLSASLLVALVFNPVLCSKFMRVPENPAEQKPRFGDRLMGLGHASYEPVLRLALRHKALTLILSVGALAGVFALFLKFNAGVELFPDTDPTYAYVRIEAPSGTHLELSDSFARTVEKAVAEVPELLAYVTEVGSGGGGDGGFSTGVGAGPAHLGLVSMEFIPHEDRTGSSREALDDLRHALADFTGAKLYIEKQEDGPPAGKPVTIEISGDDFNELGRLADLIKAEIRSTPGLVDLQDDFDRGRPEVQIRPNVDKAGRYGLRTWDIANTIRTALQGLDVSKFRVGEDEYDIVIRFAGEARRNVEDLERLTVFHEGKSIPLGAFAAIEYTTGLGAIRRIDGQRVVTVSGDAALGHNGNAVLAQVQKRLADFHVPDRYFLSFAGESEDQEEAEAFLSEAFGIAIMLILLVMITQFTSLWIPFVIISSVVLSLIGVFIGLMVTRTPFGIIMTGVGVISLAGIVVNNAIVLLDYIVKLRARGMDKDEAIVQGGKTRFRPVILTAITTILGLIPLTTGLSIDFGRLFSGDFGIALIIGGESSQWWGPMGVAVIWGLAVATFLTLVIVPVMYGTIDPIKERLRRIVGLKRRRQQPEELVASEGGG